MKFSSLADLLREARPGFASGNSDPNGVIQIRMNNVGIDGSFNLDAIRRVPKSECDLARFLVREGDILFNSTNSPELVGKTALFPGSPEPVVYSNHFLRIRVNEQHANSAYIARWLQYKRAEGIFTAMCKQWVNQASVSTDRLLAMILPCPPLPEQRRIAAILDRADALRAKRREALARLDVIAQAIFLEMFGDPIQNPLQFPMARLMDLGQISTGATPSTDRKGMFGGDIPFITPGDLGTRQPARRTITEQGASFIRTVRQGATFVCCIGATIGKMDKALVRSAFNQQINAIEWTKDITDDYGLRVLMFFKDKIISASRSTTLPILKKSSFEQIRIPVPPFRLQTALAAKLGILENLTSTGMRQAETFDAFFDSLQTRAFNGEL